MKGAVDIHGDLSVAVALNLFKEQGRTSLYLGRRAGSSADIRLRFHLLLDTHELAFGFKFCQERSQRIKGHGAASPRYYFISRFGSQSEIWGKIKRRAPQTVIPTR